MEHKLGCLGISPSVLEGEWADQHLSFQRPKEYAQLRNHLPCIIDVELFSLEALYTRERPTDVIVVYEKRSKMDVRAAEQVQRLPKGTLVVFFVKYDDSEEPFVLEMKNLANPSECSEEVILVSVYFCIVLVFHLPVLDNFFGLFRLCC